VKLWGYLPKGVVQDEEELAVFPEEMQREYLKQKGTSLKGFSFLPFFSLFYFLFYSANIN
jgi:hypothetical protein